MSKHFDDILDPEVANLLKAGKVGVLKTDTLYGVVAMAANQQAVERIYQIKNRDTSKACILLISSLNQLHDEPPAGIATQLSSIWPGKVSIILATSAAPGYLTRGGDALAYRLPNDRHLIDLIDKTGPLVAPSANKEGILPAKDIQIAKKYFKEQVDFYVDGGEAKDSAPSQIIKILKDGSIDIFRKV